MCSGWCWPIKRVNKADWSALRNAVNIPRNINKFLDAHIEVIMLDHLMRYVRPQRVFLNVDRSMLVFVFTSHHSWIFIL